ncbi:hypothetical protein [Spirosoma sp. 48-14]|uniref:hypothetical protein n=1 Tax=Spirosoma sp. 48-14 TaxID=1895854 RepID=UPI00095BCE1D|nr:hypothetical protein [Spirosoma sp. 48-14]OJW76349.1 MAG: hypothetical protein BGO59_22785 [Spirosoma sp. 48-14]
MEVTTSIRGDARAEWLSNNRDAAKILDTYLAQAEEAFKRRIQEAGLNLSGELLASFRQRAATEAEGYVEARLEMAALARIKDLRWMNYTRTPPLLAMEYYVEKVGASHFAYVSGYKKGTFPATEARAVERIAWSLKMSLAKRPNVTRGYRGIYADPLLKDVLPYLFQDLATAYNLTASRAFKAAFTD